MNHKSAWLATLLVSSLGVAAACGTTPERVASHGEALTVDGGPFADAYADDGAADAYAYADAYSDDAGFEGSVDADVPETQCVPQEQTTMLGFGLQPISFDDCDRAVRKVASIPIDQGFLSAVTSPDGLAKCTKKAHCSNPDPTTGIVVADPNGSTCDQVISTNLPPHLKGSMLPAVEIVQRTGCPGKVPTCVISHGGLFGGDYAFGPDPLDGLTCSGPGGTATNDTTTEVLELYGYADGQGNPVQGLPASVSYLAKTIGEDYCSFAPSPDGGSDGGVSADGCGQYPQYAGAYGTSLSMGAGRLAGDGADALFVSNLVSSALHVAATANVSGVDCSQLGLTRQYNLLGFPVLQTTGDGDADAGDDGGQGNGGGNVVTTALPDFFQLAFVTRIGLTDTTFPDLSPGHVPMSTFNGSVSAEPLYPYSSADQVPQMCVPLQGDTRAPLGPGEEYSGTLGSPNWVQVIPVGEFSVTIAGVSVRMQLLLTDPCCNPT